MTQNPIFKNKPNKNVWISRSIATVGLNFFICNNDIYVLVVKRSKSMEDEPDKMCLPCGYLDWDETLFDCYVREVYEETSLYLPDYEKFLINDNKKFLKINDSLSNNRQNISIYFISILKDDKLPDITSFKSNETEFVKWLNIKNINKIEYSWAFNHDNIIKENVELVKKHKEYHEIFD